MRDAVIVEAVRTPIAKGKATGALHDVHPVDLFARTLVALVERAGIDPEIVDDVVGGCVSQVAEQATNITRKAVLAAGFPESVPAMTIDRQCGSSQQAVHSAAQGVMSGAYDVVIAGGVESMSRVPLGSAVLPGTEPWGAGIADRYPDGLVRQGVSAELIASRWKIDRTEMDAFATESHRRAAAAWGAGEFDRELAWAGRDESVRPTTTVEGLAGLKPAYYDAAVAERFPEIGWNITAGNASTINDGSAALLIMGADVAERMGLRPRARFRTFAVAGDDPLLMLTAVAPATEKVLARSGLGLDEIDLFEINEAFASVVLAWQRETGADLEKVNVRGGAIAIGHPLGGSGARLMTTLLHSLEDRGARYGLQAMCEGGGLANATIIETL